MAKDIKKGIKTKITPLIGLQWGDEGKGKGVARIASGLSKKDLVVRFQGGNNAGHTIWHGGRCYVFRLLPSGIFGKPQIHLGAGMVINPGALLEESKEIPKNVAFLGRMSVSPRAVLTIPTHILMDSVSEKRKGKKKIGSTGRGISPSYTDLTLRRALRVGDIFYPDFENKYKALKREHEETLKKVFKYKVSKKDLAEKERGFWQGVKFIKKLRIEESADIVEKTLLGGHKIIAEGAQATLLDIRFGHYPYVTSSHTIAGGVSTGLGIPPSYIGQSIGVTKAYVTKVGEGPFPTELGGKKSAIWCRDKKLKDELARFPKPDKNSSDEFEQGIALRKAGSEMGAVTGRLRRTGWIDLPLLKYAIRMNEAKSLVLTKLDVFNGFKRIKACTSYVVNGKKTDSVPFDLSRVNVKPVYKTFPIWKGNLSDYGRKLPKEALDYVKFLEKSLGAPIIYVGTGPEEHHVVERYWK
ncbi:MAG: Adenylosuccinate synthetase [Parcubacteria group bacterium GW2011_GWA1_47_10]|nr:MAG: Adenylosuccinate synthetase [Parcubacteria group bacterium GW2011_GWA1_47_10]